MGAVLAILGLAISVLAVLALVRGHLNWARISNRRIAGIALTAGVVTLGVGGALSPAKPIVTSADSATPPATSSTAPAASIPQVTQTVVSTTQTPAPPGRINVQNVVGLTLDKAQGSGFSLKPIDVAPLVIKGMTGQRTRGVIVYSNWVIVAQCPRSAPLTATCWSDKPSHWRW